MKILLGGENLLYLNNKHEIDYNVLIDKTRNYMNFFKLKPLLYIVSAVEDVEDYFMNNEFMNFVLLRENEDVVNDESEEYLDQLELEMNLISNIFDLKRGELTYYSYGFNELEDGVSEWLGDLKCCKTDKFLGCLGMFLSDNDFKSMMISEGYSFEEFFARIDVSMAPIILEAARMYESCTDYETTTYIG